VVQAPADSCVTTKFPEESNEHPQNWLDVTVTQAGEVPAQALVPATGSCVAFCAATWIDEEL
jgi:hypothetical protein